MSAVTYSGLLAESVRERVLAIERRVQQLAPVDCPIRHYFIPGMYAREIQIPAGTVLTGAVHKRESIVVLSAGRLVLATEDGPLEVAAPFTMICKPGAKNLATALEDSVWTNFFVTDETDLAKLVEELTESTAAELLGGAHNVQLNNIKKEQPWLLDSAPAQ